MESRPPHPPSPPPTQPMSILNPSLIVTSSTQWSVSHTHAQWHTHAHTNQWQDNQNCQWADFGVLTKAKWMYRGSEHTQVHMTQAAHLESNERRNKTQPSTKRRPYPKWPYPNGEQAGGKVGGQQHLIAKQQNKSTKETSLWAKQRQRNGENIG